MSILIFGEDIRYSEQSALRRYTYTFDSKGLSEEAKTFRKEKMSRRHGKAIQRLYNITEPYLDNLRSLPLPDDTMQKLEMLMNHYKQLTNL